MMLTDDELKAIKARAEAASTGSWDNFHNLIRSGETIIIRFWGDDDEDYENADANANFVTSARQDVPALLDTVDDLRRQLAEAQARAEKAEAVLKELAEKILESADDDDDGEWMGELFSMAAKVLDR